ncbi:fiber protein [Human adenovirus 51]|uniref:Fiber n=3 Tax=Human adenovirus 51 TaxID=245072 RepID=M0QVW3_9ADEN|nr:fiber [Human adenovirus 51]WOZ23581.1 fiber protein [Human adenovirus 51]
MSKRLRVEDDFNPVYPYGYARNQNIPFLTPPFVSSDGFKNFPPGVLSLKLADPIAIVNGDVSLKVGGGLTVEQDSGKLKVNPKIPLQVVNDQLELATDKPFKIENNKLALDVGHGLKVIDKTISDLQGLVGKLVVLTGVGIGTETLKDKNDKVIGSAVNVRLGKDGGLDFNKKGDLVAWNRYDDRRTLWTTPDPSPNCKVSEAKDSKLTLVLTKCGSQILASVALLIVKGKYQTISESTIPKDQRNFSVKLMFDEKGKLLDKSSLDKEYWNFRSNDSVVGTAYDNAVPFMPNLKAYPKNTTTSSTNPDDKISAGKKNIVSNVYLEGRVYQPVALTVKFNSENDCAYSITFDFVWSKTYESPVAFDSSSFTFSYIAQENKDTDE